MIMMVMIMLGINYTKASIALAKMVHALSTVLDELAAPISLIYSTNRAADTADHKYIPWKLIKPSS